MAIKAEDVYEDMDRLIETYSMLGNKTKILRLSPEQWERLSNDCQRALKKNIQNHPVLVGQDGKPIYKGYTLVRHAPRDDLR